MSEAEMPQGVRDVLHQAEALGAAKQG